MDEAKRAEIVRLYNLPTPAGCGAAPSIAELARAFEVSAAEIAGAVGDGGGGC